MHWVAITCGLAVAAIGIVGMVDPKSLLEATSFARTSGGLYFVAAIRLAFGLVLIGVAAASRMPRTVRFLGAFVILSGIVTLFVSVERARAIVAWWFAQGGVFMRAWASLAVVFGLFIVYAVTPRRGAD
jgi:hypothetical protein